MEIEKPPLFKSGIRYILFLTDLYLEMFSFTEDLNIIETNKCGELHKGHRNKYIQKYSTNPKNIPQQLY